MKKSILFLTIVSLAIASSLNAMQASKGSPDAENILPYSGNINAHATDKQGKTIDAGLMFDKNYRVIVVTRFQPDSKLLDASFDDGLGNPGQIITDLGPNVEYPTEVRIDPNGQIMVRVVVNGQPRMLTYDTYGSLISNEAR